MHVTTGVVGTLQSQKGRLNNLLLLGEGIVWQQDGHFVGERLTPVGPAEAIPDWDGLFVFLSPLVRKL